MALGSIHRAIFHRLRVPIAALMLVSCVFGDEPSSTSTKLSDYASEDDYVSEAARDSNAAHGSDETAASSEFWSFSPPVAHSLPVISNPRWPRTRADHFVLAALDREQLTPAPSAERRTLIRRLSFDLTGLPPTLAEIQQYVDDPSPQATQRVVDRLLASPRFGERMASFWISLVRYGENQAHDYRGFLLDTYPNAYRFRDWVIAAFNDDLPYDQFVRLQLAADQVEGPESDHLVALSFLGLGPKYFGRGQLDVMADEWADNIETISRTFLGMTVACARCHDHKYDPISMKDYYALAGVMASTEHFNTHEMKIVEDKVKDEQHLVYNPETLHIVRDRDPRDLPVFIDGNVALQGEMVPRRFLTVLNSGSDQPLTQGSGRGELAKAIVSRENPVAARVIVNRVWDLCFGRPLVSTPSNFGTRGALPTHPQLLDDLAVRFMEQGWSFKWLVRELVLSSTYRQSTRGTADYRDQDPLNQWYWHMSRRRLPAEMWRDAVLALTDELDDEQVGGPSGDLNDRDFLRRTLYSYIDRRQLSEYLELFDYPNPNSHRPRRDQTISPLQKLYMLNHPFVLDRAEALARQLISLDVENKDRIVRAYEKLYARGPSDRELELGLTFLSKQDFVQTKAWQLYVQTLLTANEMFYLK
ncbi:MAG: DUF1549 and DUF1553 domain-containing protein [Bythopirellula sp.]